MYYAPVRRSSARIATPVTARLACVKHAASVQSEPGSNSSLEVFELSNKKSDQNPLLDFWSLGQFAPKCMTRVPTQITCRIFKQHRARWAVRGFASFRKVGGEGAASIAT